MKTGDKDLPMAKSLVTEVDFPPELFEEFEILDDSTETTRSYRCKPHPGIKRLERQLLDLIAGSIDDTISREISP